MQKEKEIRQSKLTNVSFGGGENKKLFVSDSVDVETSKNQILPPILNFE